MREYESESQDSELVDPFAELVDRLRDSDDAGLTAFNDELLEIQKHLTQEYVTGGMPCNYREIEDTDKDLGEKWSHHNDIALVSGRVYLTDDAIVEEAPEEWGEPQTDEDGQFYYDVEDVQLRSLGAETAVAYNQEEGRIQAIYVGYAFAFHGDVDEEQSLFARVGDLYRHTYEEPTFHEAAVRLERDWLRQAELIREWLHADTKTSVPARIQYIIDELQKDFIKSEPFRQYVERYIQTALEFDQGQPYSITTTGELQYYHAENSPDAQDETGEWLAFDVGGQLSLLGHYPKAELLRRNDGTVYAAIRVARFSEEGGDKPEYVRLNTEGISMFRSTRAAASLMSAAVFNTMQTEAMRASLNDIFDPTFEDTSAEAEIEVAVQSEVMKEKVPERIQQLLEIEHALKELAKNIRGRQERYYTSADEARMASIAFVKRDTLELFREITQKNNVQFIVSGEGALRPVGTFNATEDNGMTVFTYSQPEDKSKALMPLEMGDSLRGYYQSMIPGIDAIQDVSTDEMVYRINPSIALATKLDRISFAELDGVPLVNLAVATNVAVSLDGSAEIKMSVLEEYREVQAELELLSSKGDFLQSPTASLAYALRNAYLEEDPNSFAAFEDVALFSSLENLGDDLLLAAGLFEKMLVGKRVRVAGDFYQKNDTGGYEPISLLSEAEGMHADIIDIRHDILGDDLFAVLSHSDDIFYLKMNTVTRFMF